MKNETVGSSASSDQVKGLLPFCSNLKWNKVRFRGPNMSKLCRLPVPLNCIVRKVIFEQLVSGTQLRERILNQLSSNGAILRTIADLIEKRLESGEQTGAPNPYDF